MTPPAHEGPAHGAHLPAVPLDPVASPSLRPWAGSRLGAAGEGIGELWLAGPDSRVRGGSDDGITLDGLAGRHGAGLVGARGMALLGPRFPLIVKLIDAAEPLSLQVHPDDALARELYGADAVGKAEAWVVLDAGPDTELITGPRRGLSEEDLRAEIGAGTMDREHCATTPAGSGDTFMLYPGTIHAIAAGSYVYEIEQPSDLTFRISDWGRAGGRQLHREEALRAVDARAHARQVGTGWALDGGALTVPEFRLELLAEAGATLRRPAGNSLEVVTVLRGSAVVRGEGFVRELEATGTTVVPALVPAYEIELGADALVAIGSIP